ncbi:MAG: LTA synthase family protein [Tannerella sp.]|jgi:phosphoglycerol transferase MdoB-like AlkP superfamily enzyme|nr:LTA synthase family protein [Tannerella sp.]
MSKKFVAFFLLLLFKILWFDYSWCAISTFRPFSYAETYIFAVLLALLLSAPAVFFRRALWIRRLIALFTGLVLIANLLYFRTYFTAIPLSSYRLLPNLIDFSGSVFGSFRWGDALFPVSTVVWWLMGDCFTSFAMTGKGFASSFSLAEKMTGRGAFASSFSLSEKMTGKGRPVGFWGLCTVLVAIFGGVLLWSKGGFVKAYESLQDSYTHTCGTPIYTVIGSLCYDYVLDKDVCTPETLARIEGWRNDKEWGCNDGNNLNKFHNLVKVDGVGVNCILILAESFESWVIGKTVEGQEITPYLNRLIGDSTTIYAPHILSQVNGGRSIDAQLMINTGLLPVKNGVYSIKYPYSFYPSLAKAMKQKYGAGKVRACVLTADKPIVWNQNVIAPAFGYDSLVSKADFLLDEKVGPHYRRQLGDRSLLRQCAEKILNGEVWREDGANLVQIVTYSGHFPFTLPANLRQVRFSDALPAVLRDYLTVANYTDRALGEFVSAIRSERRFDNTLIVITGDREGLAGMRQELRSAPAGMELVPAEPFVPLIINASNLTGLENLNNVLNLVKVAPHVYGQVDIYPTLLELLGLTDYDWKGLGTSILTLEHPGVAIDSHGALFGDTTGIAPDCLLHLKEAWSVSDDIIKYNYFKIK